MVYYFRAVDGTLLYMGKDKFETEGLIKHGWPEDVWFHVDNLSSAHVYVRMTNRDESIPLLDSLSEDLVRDCAQLVKANSIEGCKKSTVTVIYTPWSNLKKDGGMDVGQVGFFNEKLVKKFIVMERDKEVLKRIAKSKEETYPDLAAERKQRDDDERANLKAGQREKSKQENNLFSEENGVN